MARIFNLFPWRRRRMEHDLDRELRYHLDRRVEELMRSGSSGAEARRLASLEFGGISRVQEEVRDTWTSRWLADMVRDVRYAARTLRRSPTFTAAAILSLALGIGANAAIFSLFDQVLLRRLPVDEPERLVLLDWKGSDLADGYGSGNLMSYPLCRDLQEQERIFDGVFCRYPTTVNLSTGQEPQPVGAEIVSGSYFSVLGVHPESGRLIDESDDVRPGAYPVVALSYDYWQSSLGGAADVVGSTVRVNNHPMTVIGIAAAGFRGVDLGNVPAVWIPAMMKRQATPEWNRLLDRRAVWLHVFGRLRAGISVEEARAGLQPWFKAMLEADTRREDFPRTTEEQRRSFFASTIEVLPAPRGRSTLRGSLREPLAVLMAGTLLLLLLACLNVANLFLARGAARSKEVITRMALGAQRGSVIRQLLVDGALIAVAGGALGLIAAPFVSRVLLSFLAQDTARLDLTSRIDHRVLLFAFVVSVVSAGFSCLAPALQVGRVPLISVLTDRSSIATGGGIRLRKALVVAQVAFTLILLIGAGLFVQTLESLYAKGPGFATANLLSFELNPRHNGYSIEKSHRIVRTLLEQLRSLPEVESASIAGLKLLDGGTWTQRLTIEADARFVTERGVYLNPVSASFFSTLGTRVIAGRDLEERDMPAVGEPARLTIVNESFARSYFGDRNPVGRRIGLGSRPDTKANIEIVGVVRDFTYGSLREQSEQAFLPGVPAFGAGWFYLRVRGRPEAAFASVRAAVAEVDPTLPLLSLRTLDDQIDRSLTTERMLATLSSGFGAIALLLSVVGLYGLMSFVVTQRTREIGIRAALGATRAGAVWLIGREALIMIGASTTIALACAWPLGRLIEAQLFGVQAVDGTTLAVSSTLLAIVALGAAMLPAWRAASVSPTEALRFE